MSIKNTVWRVFTGDYTQVGYQIGAKQAQAGQPKTFFALFSKINMINHAGWQSKHAYQTMKTGINQGYDDKLLAQNIAQTLNLNQQGTNSMTKRNYDDILTGIDTAKSNVELNIQHLTQYMNNYEQKIENMEQAQFLTNYTNQIKGENGLRALVDDLKALLEDFLNELDSIKKDIEEDKETANSNSH